MAKTGHSLYVRQNSMTNEALSVYCTCGEFYERADYATVNAEGEHVADREGVPLSVLMDIAEHHFADVD